MPVHHREGWSQIATECRVCSQVGFAVYNKPICAFVGSRCCVQGSVRPPCVPGRHLAEAQHGDSRTLVHQEVHASGGCHGDSDSPEAHRPRCCSRWVSAPLLKGNSLSVKQRLTFGLGFLRFRHLLPLWRPEWGGGLRQPERYQPGGSATPMEADLLLRPCAPGLCSRGLAGQSSQQGSCTGSLLPEGQGEKESIGWVFATAPSTSNNIHSCFSTGGDVPVASSCFPELGTVL